MVDAGGQSRTSQPRSSLESDGVSVLHVNVDSVLRVCLDNRNRHDRGTAVDIRPEGDVLLGGRDHKALKRCRLLVPEDNGIVVPNDMGHVTEPVPRGVYGQVPDAAGRAVVSNNDGSALLSSC